LKDPHPIRVWRHDRDLEAKIDALRRFYREGRKKFGEPVNGVQLYEMPISVDPALVPTFRDLQGLLYKQQTSTQFLTYFQNYWDSHRQMFCFDPALTDSLSNTDVSDVPWDAIRLPHSEFHVSWGDFGQESFWIGDLEYVIDGAYIRRVPQESILFPNDTILITFTSQLVFPSYKEAKEARSAQGYHFSEPIYDFAMSGAGVETVGQAIGKGEEEYLRYCRSLDDQLLQSAHNWAPEVDVLPIGERIRPFQGKFERGIEIIRGSVPLLFNVIFYLTQRPGERVIRYPDTAPKGQVKRLTSESNTKVRKSIADSLLRKGYSEVTFIRDPEVTSASIGGHTDRSIRSHWRRGHWRNQPYGENLTKRKWNWIMPVLVKKGDDFKVGTKHNVAPES